MKKDTSYPKDEKLKSRKLLSSLFEDGKSVFKHPIKVQYTFIAHDHLPSNHKIGVSVSKRSFKRAVDRNRIKRQMREAYRNQKYILTDLSPNDQWMAIMMIYIGKEMPIYQELHHSIGQVLELLRKKLVAQLQSQNNKV